jgi:hypothetical protein
MVNFRSWPLGGIGYIRHRLNLTHSSDQALYHRQQPIALRRRFRLILSAFRFSPIQTTPQIVYPVLQDPHESFLTVGSVVNRLSHANRKSLINRRRSDLRLDAVRQIEPPLPALITRAGDRTGPQAASHRIHGYIQSACGL